MKLPFTSWPDELQRRYREQGYWLDEPLTARIDSRAHSDAVAVVCGPREIRYRELHHRAENLAHYFCRLGLKPGDTALVQLPNVAEFYIVFFALLKAGIAPVNALMNHQPLELRAYADQLRPTLLIATDQHPLFSDDHFARELRQSGCEHCLLLGDSRWAPSLSEAIEAEPTAMELPRIDPMAVAFFQLSGGSTGTPKLIPRTHNDYDYSVRRSVDICAVTSDTRYLCALPAAHNFPLSSPGALGVFYAGGRLILAPSPEPLACFELIYRHQVTMTALVPSALILWLQTLPGHEHTLTSLQVLQVGGASFAESLARRVPHELGCRLQQVFGMAEGLVNYTRLDDAPEIIYTTQGRPMSPADEVKVVDTLGRSVPRGEVGQLITRGPYTCRGYYQAPEHNARVFDDEGFYYSGDLVQQDSQGNLQVVGRVKDQINRGGEKIAAEEIENLLLSHPQVSHAAVIAVPDPVMGEKSCACLVTGNHALKPAVLRRFLRSRGIADFKLPDRFRFMPDLPLTAVGKTDKQRLREQMYLDIGTAL